MLLPRLLVLLLAPAAPWIAPGQDPGPVPAGPPAVAADDEGDRLVKEFGLELHAWNTRRVQLSRGGKVPEPRELGPHPATQFRGRFQALVEKGNAWAAIWWLDNLQHLTDAADVAGRKRAFLELFDKLVPKEADHRGMMHVLGAVQAHGETLGAATVDSLLERVVDASHEREVQARAAHMRAGLHMRAKGGEPAREAEGLEMHRHVVATWSGTTAAMESAQLLVPYVQRELEQKEREWTARCLELQKAGRPPSEWPRQPLYDAQAAMLPLAQTGAPFATRWTQRFLPAVLGQEAAGPGPFLTRLAIELGPGYPILSDTLEEVRLGIVELLLRQFAAEPCADELLAHCVQYAERLTPDLAERALAPVLEGSDPGRKAKALHALIRASLATGEWKRYLAALELGARMERECAGDPMLGATQSLVAGVRALLPGEPAPDFEVQDAENKRFKLSDYRGRVVLLCFYNFFLDQGLADVAKWQAFQAKQFRRPFTMLGANIGAAEPQSYTDRASKLGMSWRVGLFYQATPDVLRPWLVRKYPTVVVIDAEGKLRARDLPWEETTKLVEQLIAETEAKNGPK